MPIREREHVYKIAKKSALNSATGEEKTDALQAIANNDRRQADDPAHWNEEDALRLLITNHWQNPAELREVIGRRFFARGDRRLGFYTLLLSSGERWEIDRRVELKDGTTTRMDPLSNHPHSSLARYIARQLRDTRLDKREGQRPTEESQHDFVAQLAEYQELCRDGVPRSSRRTMPKSVAKSWTSCSALSHAATARLLPSRCCDVCNGDMAIRNLTAGSRKH